MWKTILRASRVMPVGTMPSAPRVPSCPAQPGIQIRRSEPARALFSAGDRSAVGGFLCCCCRSTAACTSWTTTARTAWVEAGRRASRRRHPSAVPPDVSYFRAVAKEMAISDICNLIGWYHMVVTASLSESFRELTALQLTTTFRNVLPVGRPRRDTECRENVQQGRRPLRGLWQHFEPSERRPRTSSRGDPAHLLRRFGIWGGSTLSSAVLCTTVGSCRRAARGSAHCDGHPGGDDVGISECHPVRRPRLDRVPRFQPRFDGSTVNSPVLCRPSGATPLVRRRAATLGGAHRS